MMLFCYYDPFCYALYYLPVEFKDRNKVFSSPHAVMKSIRPEIESTSCCTKSAAGELKIEEDSVDPLDKNNSLYPPAFNVAKAEAAVENVVDGLRYSQGSLESEKLVLNLTNN
jgi:hypothetical protein